MLNRIETNQADTKPAAQNFVANTGEMAKRISEFNWSGTSLGPMKNWPQSLLTTLSIMLHSRFPMVVYWGPELICLYNDAFRPSLGNSGKHPYVLGKPGKEVWPEAWDTIYPTIDTILQGGEAFWSEDQLIPIYRNGAIEEVFWTFSFSPLIDEKGNRAGILTTCHETTQKIQTVRQLEEKKDELLFAIEAAELATWDLNPATNKITANKRMKEWFGLPLDKEPELGEAKGMIAEKDQQRVDQAILNALDYSTGGHYNIDYTIVHPVTKAERIVKAKGRAWFNEEKVAYRFNGTLQDITAEVQARQELESSEAKLRSIIAAAPAGIGVFMGRDLIIESPNQKFIDIVGKGWGVVGKPLREAMPELITEDQPFLKILDDVYTSGKMFQSFASLVKIVQKGVMTYNYYNITYTPLFNSEGQVYAILDIAIDVTEEIKAMQRLEESETRFRTMAEDSEILIALADETGNATYFSKAWTDLTGRPLENLLSFGWADLIHPDDRQGYIDIYLNALKKREPFTGEFRVLNKDEQYRWLLAKGPPRFNPDGSFAGYISSCVDITERKKAEKSLEAKNSQLLRINADLDNFIYTASHDLKAPMSNIEGLLNYLRDSFRQTEGALDEETEMLLQLMESSVNRFKNTILDLTEITKVQKSEEADIQEIDLAELVTDLKLSIQDKIQEANATIETDFSAAPTIKFSKKNLKSVVFNLLSNAIKYRQSGRDSRILLRTEKTKNYTVLYFQDNGLGIKPEDHDKLFSMFKRFHDHVEGTGIGLYIIKRIVDNAGGKIEVDSTEGVGTTFKIYFPAKQ